MTRSWLVLCACIHLYAQDVSFDVSPRQIGINENIQFSIVIKGDDDGRAPTFVDRMNTGKFELERGNPSVSTSMSIVNGRRDSSKTYTYLLRPTEKGKLEFPSQTLIVGSQTYKTPPVVVDVGDENLSVTTRRDPFDFPVRRRPQSSTAGEVFGTVEVPKNSYYLGESIPLDVYVYITPRLFVVGRESGVQLPDLKDFWVEDVERQPEEPSLVMRKDQRWKRYTVFSKRLFATKTGTLTIPEAEFQLSVSNSPRGSFFDTNVPTRRRSEPVTLEIKPLPSAGKPKGFSGLVGQFSLKGELEATETKVGDSVNVQMVLTGAGNFNAISELTLDGLGDAFEVFPGGAPQVRTEAGVAVDKTWNIALVPKRRGSFEIRIPTVAFFDPKTEQYVSTGGQTFTLEVAAGEGLGTGTRIGNHPGGTPLNAEEDINFVMIDPLELDGGTDRPADPMWLVKVAGGFLVLDILLFLGLLVRERMAGMRAGNRAGYALRNFRRALGKLRASGEDADQFYRGLSHAVLGYFGDKWEREGQGISLDVIRDRFERDGISEDLYQKIAEVIEASDLARFTPSTSESREGLLHKAREVVEAIEGAMS